MTVPVHGLPAYLSVGMEVQVVPPNLRGPRTLVVTSCDQGKTGQLVAFRGILNIADASELVGKTLLVSKDCLPEDFPLHDRERLLGRTVVDVAAGEVGVIEEVLVSPAHDVWVCRGARGETLVPVIADMVVSLAEEGPIEVALPEGLLEEG